MHAYLHVCKNCTVCINQLPYGLPHIAASLRRRNQTGVFVATFLKKYGFVAVLLALGVAGAGYYFTVLDKDTMAGIAYGNGRIEAQSIDIATRTGARILSIPVEEGQMVAAGDVVAELDMGDLSASVAGAEANVRSVTQSKEAAASSVTQAEAALVLAEKEFERDDGLAKFGAVSQSRRDQTLNAKQAAEAQLAAARKNLRASEEAIAVAEAEVRRLQDLLKDSALRASKTGRVLYKLTEPGEVVAAGGKVVTLLDLTDVYMTIFLPTAEVGRLQLGQEARIVLDAVPETAIPAYISYISPEAQFTPRQVETRTEREKLTFRVKVRIPPELLEKYIDYVKTGLPGMAYIRIDQSREWPASLKIDPALIIEAKDTEE